jgi:peptidoglycan/LPS O-acetylase OafA/YrhL
MSIVTTSSPLIRPRMPELDSLRGVAVLGVLLFHGFYFSTGAGRFHGAEHWFLLITAPGWVGVNLFFVLSGFLITGILVDSRHRPDYYRNFYVRRALRILPAYYSVLFLLLVASRSGMVMRHASWAFIGLGCIYLVNVSELFGVPTQYTVLWTLAVEEHFYLLWPTAVRQASRRWLPWICVAIIVVCPALRSFCYWRGYQYGAGYTWLVADGLAWGALLAWAARGRFSSRQSMLKFGLVCASASVLIAVALLPYGMAQSGTYAGGVMRGSLINSFFAGVLAIALVNGTGAWKNLLHIPVLRFLGEISYGLYLIHMLAFDVVDRVLISRGLRVSWASGGFGLILARFAAGSLLALGIAYISRWKFEERFLRLKDRLTERPRGHVSSLEEGQVLEAKAAS